MPKIEFKYFCNGCDFKCYKLSNYNTHCSTRKHLKVTQCDANNVPDDNNNDDKIYNCNICNKIYKSRNGLWMHKKQCLKEQQIIKPEQEKIDKADKIEKTEQQDKIDSNLIMSVIKDELTNIVTNQLVCTAETNKQSQEFQKQNLELQQQMFTQIIELIKTNMSTTNNIVNGNVNNYTQFNLQLYLNETCKNAMTINDFLDYLQPTVQELEDTAHLGYVESISRIIMRGFKNLEEEELPFHCTDLKREHIYVKNPDKEWVKETDKKPLLLRFVKEVARRNFNNIFAWQKQNPSWSNYHSKQNDMYNSIVANAMSGATEKEQNDNYEKIMKNIMKNIVIDKSKKNKK
jgi:hypothetical protein